MRFTIRQLMLVTALVATIGAWLWWRSVTVQIESIESEMHKPTEVVNRSWRDREDAEQAQQRWGAWPVSELEQLEKARADEFGPATNPPPMGRTSN